MLARNHGRRHSSLTVIVQDHRPHRPGPLGHGRERATAEPLAPEQRRRPHRCRLSFLATLAVLAIDARPLGSLLSTRRLRARPQRSRQHVPIVLIVFCSGVGTAIVTGGAERSRRMRWRRTMAARGGTRARLSSRIRELLRLVDLGSIVAISGRASCIPALEVTVCSSDSSSSRPLNLLITRRGAVEILAPSCPDVHSAGLHGRPRRIFRTRVGDQHVTPPCRTSPRPRPSSATTPARGSAPSCR